MKRLIKKEDLENLSKEITEKAKNQKVDTATIVSLSGNLGAGKTTLTKEIARCFNIQKEIISPTFVIMKIYEIKDNNWKKFIHIDAYRLENEKNLDFLDFNKIISDKENFIVIEWPEIIKNYIPKNIINIKISHNFLDKESRFIEFF